MSVKGRVKCAHEQMASLLSQMLMRTFDERSEPRNAERITRLCPQDKEPERITRLCPQDKEPERITRLCPQDKESERITRLCPRNCKSKK